MQLFEHVPVPFRANDGFVTVRARRSDHILVSQGNRLHIELSAADLSSRCTRLGTYHLCAELGYLRRDMKSSCLGALMTNAMGVVPQLCRIQREQPIWDVFGLGDHRFLLFSLVEENVILECGKNRTNFKFAGLHELSLPSGCFAYTAAFELRPADSDSLQVHLVSDVAWSDTGLELPLNTSLPDRVKIPDLVIAPVDRVVDDILAKATIEEHRRDRDTFLWVAVALAGFIALIFISCVLYLLVRYCHLRRSPIASVIGT
jgi:hypothetical protein